MTSFRALEKAVLSKEQLTAFQSSKTYEKVTSYIETLNNSVIGFKLTDECAQSQGVTSLIEVLDRVEALAKETPPVDNSASRFGNPAFRTFYDKVQQVRGRSLSPPPFPPENRVSGYFCESWGNRARIDMGAGWSSIFFAGCDLSRRVGVVRESDHVALVVKVFWRYIQVMRTLQSTYWLEPAGSHGVWGLDDYHFLPFLFGSAQLRGHKYLRPKSIHDNEVVEEVSKDYMYFACIRFINSIKTASLRWHSPMLDDISAVKTWDKVNQGMIKMYHAEVLGKLPVVQHFLFGSILSYEGPVGLGPLPASEEHHHHGHTHGTADAPEMHAGWHDPCGIPVPSAFAAAAEAQKIQAGASLGGPGIRPVPFD
ncbi:hypothetical protein BC826DRAFT_1090081 [Russula brevipes]|nr:hypothetical protein BC826DRAFT_1090081 [Russula brevipes]